MNAGQMPRLAPAATPGAIAAAPAVLHNPSAAGHASAADALGSQLGSTLLAQGIVDRVELDYIRQKQSVSGQPLWRVLIDEGLAGEAVVVRALAGLQGIAFVELAQLDPPEPAVLALFNRELCLTANFMPLRQQANGLLVLLGDALPEAVTQTVMRRTGLRCAFVQAAFSSVTQFIRNTYHFAANPPEKLARREIARLADDSDHAHTPEPLLGHLLHWAVRERATDIHVTPGAAGLHVLFRIDGVLQPIVALPLPLVRLLGYIKLRAEMDISEQRRPQDGSFRASVLDAPLTVRVSTLVTEFGERTVMRLLPESHDVKDLAGLGFFPEDVAIVAQAMASPVGLVLITGPTGSGKSSTLHAGLRMQHLIERNVLTVEDPLEYRVPAAGQTEVNRRAGYDFGAALRHFLRHDPDVILVGEMRDPETAQAALEAAATGHLVLSTLHVTTVFGVVPRLRPMGLLPQVIAENLRLVINQRLVRQLCRFCSEDAPFTAAERAWLGLDEPAQGRGRDNVPGADVQDAPRDAPDAAGVEVGVAAGAASVPHGKCARGCARCRQTGFHGRLPLYELLVIDERLTNAIADDAGREALRTLAHASGFQTISAVAKRRVLLGQTTAAEVYRVIGEGPGAAA